MEGDVKPHILTITVTLVDPLHYAYRVEEVWIMYHWQHIHLELPNTSARLLFSDFSSAFNSLQSHILANKLPSHFHLDAQVTWWILNFLTNRSQRIGVNNTSSNLTTHLERLLSRLCTITSALRSLYWWLQIHTASMLPDEVCRWYSSSVPALRSLKSSSISYQEVCEVVWQLMLWAEHE